MNQIVFFARPNQRLLAFVVFVTIIGLLAQLFLPTKSVFAATNTVLNPEFDSGTSGWFTWADTGISATFSVDTSSKLSGVNSAKMAISAAGANDWQIQLFQDQAITNGRTYNISFMARASAARTMKVVIVDTSGSPIYFSQVVNLTTTAQTFGPYTFNSTTTSSASQLAFFMGGNASTVYLDNIQMLDMTVTATPTRTPTKTITKTPTNTPTPTITLTPTATTVTANNLVLNPQFDSGNNSWAIYNGSPASATFSIDATSKLSGVNSAKVAVSNAGSADWQIQLYQDRAITNGHTYNISFMARASAARTISVVLVDTSGNPVYFSQTVNLTTSAQTFGPYTFNSTTTSSASQLAFFMGGNASTVYLDNVQMLDTAGGGSGEFFDDFTYLNSSDTNLTSLWTVRNQSLKGPGPSNCFDAGGNPGKADWLPGNISFIVDPGNSANKLLRLQAPTNGTCAGTSQAEISTHAIKFLDGTYAARIRLYDYPLSGTRGNHTINETFFSASDYETTTGTDVYSELDFTEYLPNGAWGNPIGSPYEWFTSWYNDDPTDSQENSIAGSYDGWRTIVTVVSGGQMKYYVDGVLLATHGGKYYPRSLMSIYFNIWYTGSLGTSTAIYVQDVDWTYFAQSTSLTTAQVQTAVDGLRTQGLARKDTVP